jgi:hypothetical protein
MHFATEFATETAGMRTSRKSSALIGLADPAGAMLLSSRPRLAQSTGERPVKAIATGSH